jgi:predicted P-loop ATPase/GTPase
LVAESLLNEDLLVDREYVEGLVSDNSRVEVSSLEDVHDFEASHFEEAVESCFSFIEKESEIVLIESFNDTVWPWEKLDVVDEILAIRPGQMLTYEPKRYRKAVRVIDNNKHRVREITFTRISDYLKPKQSITLRPKAQVRDDEIITFINSILRKE